MVISTLFLSHSSSSEGWTVEIDGLIHSQRQSFLKQFPKTLVKNQGGCTLLVTQAEEPDFKSHQSKPPLHIVLPFLKQIGQSGYQLVSTDSSSDENGFRKTTLWTFQAKP